MRRQQEEVQQGDSDEPSARRQRREEHTDVKTSWAPTAWRLRVLHDMCDGIGLEVRTAMALQGCEADDIASVITKMLKPKTSAEGAKRMMATEAASLPGRPCLPAYSLRFKCNRRKLAKLQGVLHQPPHQKPLSLFALAKGPMAVFVHLLCLRFKTTQKAVLCGRGKQLLA